MRFINSVYIGKEKHEKMIYGSKIIGQLHVLVTRVAPRTSEWV